MWLGVRAVCARGCACVVRYALVVVHLPTSRCTQARAAYPLLPRTPTHAFPRGLCTANLAVSGVAVCACECSYGNVCKSSCGAADTVITASEHPSLQLCPSGQQCCAEAETTPATTTTLDTSAPDYNCACYVALWRTLPCVWGAPFDTWVLARALLLYFATPRRAVR